jgi:hypothetical protein
MNQTKKNQTGKEILLYTKFIFVKTFSPLSLSLFLRVETILRTILTHYRILFVTIKINLAAFKEEEASIL